MRYFFQIIVVGLLFPLTLAAQKKISEADLQLWFSKLAADKAAVIDSVRFTGNDLQKTGGFFMQRGTGKGWTAGLRITLHGVKPSMAKKLEAALKNFSGSRHDGFPWGTARILMIEDVKHVYVFDYTADSTLYYLSATVENEASIPVNWRTAKFVDATKPNPFKNCTETELRQLGLARLWAGIKRNFVFYDRIRINWDSLYAATIPQITAAKDHTECYEILQRMAAQAGDGHTFVYGGNEDHHNTPLLTKFIDRHIYVDAVGWTNFKRQGLQRGDELLTVNGIPVMDWGRQKVMPLVSSSTAQWTLHRTYDGQDLLGGRKNETLQLVFLSHGDTLKIDYTLGSGKWDCYEEEPLMTYRKLKGDVGYLRIREFYGDDFDKELYKYLGEMQDTKALIIDLRGNGGGNSRYAEHLLRNLSTDSIRVGGWSSPCYIPAYASWNMQQPVHRQAPVMIPPSSLADYIYTRPIAILVDGGTFSAAEDFCAAYVCMKRGHIIGTPTGGSTGNGVRIELIPGHSYANICSKHDIAPDGTEFVGIGVKPDIVVEETYKTYFLDKYDAATTCALQLLKEQQLPKQ